MRIIPMLGRLVALGGILGANASLLFYAGFDSGSASAPLAGLSPGQTAIGLTGTWSATANGLVYRTPNDGLQFPANVDFPMAGGFLVREPAYSPISAQIPLTKSVDFNEEGAVLFLSFLYRDHAANPDNEMTVTLDGPEQRFSVGWLYRDALGFGKIDAGKLAYQDSRQFQFQAVTDLGGDTPYFVVVKVVTHSADPDEVYLKVYNALADRADSDEPAEWSAVGSLDLTDVATHLGVTSEGVNQSSVDEIRMGTEWKDVVKASAVATVKIVAPPVSRVVALGGTASFSVTATGEGALSYQWRRNGAVLAGATEAALSIAAVTANDAGAYTVEVRDASGGLKVSDPATLTVADSPNSGIALHSGIRFEGYVGLHYRVDYREAAEAAEAWKPLQDIPTLAATPFTVFDPRPADAPQRFYRTVVLP